MPPKRSVFGRARAIGARYARLILGLAVVGAGMGSLAVWDWRLELLSHFLPFYLLCTVLGALVIQQPRWRIGLFLISLALAWQWGTALYSRPVAPTVKQGPFRAIAFNLLITNNQFPDVERWLLAQRPDAVLLTEATPLWHANLSILQRALPYGCAAWEDSPFGIALLLKSAPKSCEVRYTDEQYQLFPYIRIVLASNTVIYGIHPPPPLGEELATARNLALAILAERIAKEPHPVLVLGDMNITPYSPLYQAFRRDANLSELGFSSRPTWSPIQGLPLLPLDRALVRGLGASLQIGPNLGSDHRPILLDVL